MKIPIVGPILGRAGRVVAAALDLGRLNIEDLRRERDRVVARADAHMPAITRVLPVPRAIPLGGGPRVASELQLDDLAELQAWLEGEVPHPLAGMPPAWADPDPGTRPARLAAAWEAAAAWPPRLGTDRAAELLGSDAGRAFFLALCLRKCDPTFGAAEALALLPEVTPAEWAGLLRVAYGVIPREEIAGELAPDPVPPGRAANWCLSAHNATQVAGIPDYTRLGRLYLSQWRNLCAEGKAAEFTPAFAAAAKRVRAAIEGLNRAE